MKNFKKFHKMMEKPIENWAARFKHIVKVKWVKLFIESLKKNSGDELGIGGEKVRVQME